jgi:heparanase 1
MARRALFVAAALLRPAAASRAWRTFPNTNAVNGCGNVCANSSSLFICMGSFPSAAACAAHAAAARVPQYTWSSGSTHCWTRTDGAWMPEAGAGAVSGCDDAAVAGCAPPAPPPPVRNVTAAVGARVARTHALHPAVALDFWRADDPTFGGKWGRSSALTIDLASPALLAAARALAPALLRLGGSPEDSLVYDDGDGACAPQSGGDGPFAPYFCSQVHPYTYDCLTRARWFALLEFAAATGLRIALGLNGCYGRASRTAPMNTSNAEALFAATAASPHAAALWGFELSNEVVPGTIDAAAWARDAAALKGAAAAAFAAAGLPPPPLVGPDQSCCDAQAGVVAAAPAGTLAALTYHEYPECTDGAAGGFVLAPSCLLRIDQHAAAVAAIAAAAPAPRPAAWMGEGADHSGGGVAGLTDTFISSFYTAWLYGAAAAAGVELTARQCLSGGDYELLQRNNSFAPNPDFWTVWLFRTLVGGAADVFNVIASAPPSSGVRVFAFSAAAGTGARRTLLAINLQVNASTSVALGGDAGAAARTEFHLTAPDRAAAHGAVACNGRALAVDAATHAPPDWRALGAPAAAGAPVVLAPASIAFVLVE